MPLTTCPACQRDVQEGQQECPHCGVVFAKWSPHRDTRISSSQRNSALAIDQKEELKWIEEFQQRRFRALMAYPVLWSVFLLLSSSSAQSLMSGWPSDLLIGLMVACGVGPFVIMFWIYRCPNCRRHFVFGNWWDVDKGDRIPMGGPRSCPNCGVRLRQRATKR